MRTIAFVGDSRGVQFPMFALDKDREVGGCDAEASIRSQGLKTEAGDIPGVRRVGEGGVGGGEIETARAVVRKVESIEAHDGTTTYYCEDEPVYKHRQPVQPQYIEANPTRKRSYKRSK